MLQRRCVLMSRSQAASLVFDIDQIGVLMCEHSSRVVTERAATYLTAVLEYLMAEVLELAGNQTKEDEVTKSTIRDYFFFE